MKENQYIHYTTVSYSGCQLLKKHALDDHGIWQIYGEDSNPDLHGSHYTPLLATVEGKLDDVINYAIELPRWSTWGGGGEIKKIEVLKVDSESAVRRAAIELELKETEKRVGELKRLLEK